MSGMRTPPGRAGRLRLRRKLATAQRACDLLDRKLRILRREHERLGLLAERTADRWEEACRRAETWMLRAALLAGQRGIRLATTTDQATVRIDWAATMGTRYPVAVVYTPPPTSAHRLVEPLGSAALYEARDAYQHALDAAAQHAAAAAAARIVDDEVKATRIRLRAIQDRSIPQLLDALARLELAVDEQEHADTARLGRAKAGDSPASATSRAARGHR